jgi:2',3'-cyclic-nucleotide 2'-phosphodiesterase (5'-nucleotidase family)
VERVDGTAVAAPGWRLDHYVRVKLRIDPSATGPRRAQVIADDLVPVAAPPGTAVKSVDPAFDQRIAEWQSIVDRAFGEVIGFTATGFARKSPELGRWVVRAWREQLSVDVAATTRGAIRQEIPPGPIQLATVYSVLPFENTLVVSTVPGEALAGLLERDRMIFAGVSRRPDGTFVLPSGAPLDPTARYTVATTDYLYLSEGRYRLKEVDPGADQTGTDWRTPVVAWTRKLASSEERPLESLLTP